MISIALKYLNILSPLSRPIMMGTAATDHFTPSPWPVATASSVVAVRATLGRVSSVVRLGAAVPIVSVGT